MTEYEVQVDDQWYALSVPDDTQDVGAYIDGFVQSMKGPEMGWVEAGGRKALERTGQLAGEFGQALIDVTDRATGVLSEPYLPEDLQVDVTDPEWSPESMYSPKKVFDRQQAKARRQEELANRPMQMFVDALKESDFGYEEDYSTIDQVIEADGFWNTAEEAAKFMTVHGIGSMADMAAIIASPTSYLAARTSELASDRARNNGRDKPTDDDYVKGFGTAVISVAADKFGLSKLQAAKLSDSFLKSISKKTGAEVGTEAFQETEEYLGTTLDTKKDVTLEEAGKSALGGALGAVGPAATIGTATDIASRIEKKGQTKREKAEEKAQRELNALLAEREAAKKEKQPTVQSQLETQEDIYGPIVEWAPSSIWQPTITKEGRVDNRDAGEVPVTPASVLEENDVFLNGVATGRQSVESVIDSALDMKQNLMPANESIKPKPQPEPEQTPEEIDTDIKQKQARVQAIQQQTEASIAETNKEKLSTIYMPIINNPDYEMYTPDGVRMVEEEDGVYEEQTLTASSALAQADERISLLEQLRDMGCI